MPYAPTLDPGYCQPNPARDTLPLVSQRLLQPRRYRRALESNLKVRRADLHQVAL